jgi:phosphoglycerate dehydrogenase-like enzyme
LIGEREFGLMKPGALLINAARGPIVVAGALLAALQGGRLAGAALDVWDREPTGADNPLLRLDNVVVAPHIASASAEGRRRNQQAAAEGALGVLRGERPGGLVNPEVWDLRRR